MKPRPRATRYAAVWVPHHAAAALVRHQAGGPASSPAPLAVVVTGVASRVVLDASPEAWARGVRSGMSAAEAAARVHGLDCREQDVEAERAATAALLDAAWTVSPRVERVGPGEVRLDLAGVPGAGGRGDAQLARRLAAAVAAVGLTARVAVADTREAASLATRARPGLTLVPPGRTTAWLAPLPVTILEPNADLGLTLERWGIRTLGELARLPRPALLARLGPLGGRLQQRALGQDLAPLVPEAPPETWGEAVALDWEILDLAALAFVLQRLLGHLAARLALRDLGATGLRLTLGLADGATHEERLTLTAPLREPRILGALFRVTLERRRLSAPVTTLRIEAAATRLDPLQADLFAPSRPSPRVLGETLGRLAALVGHEGVGAPRIPDTHRPTAGDLAPFAPPPVGAPAGAQRRTPPAKGLDRPALAVRRLVPPLEATVSLRDDRPAHVETSGPRGGPRGAVQAAAGPWRTAGEWWADTAWDREEWDVALADGTVARLVRDTATGAFTLDAVYD